MQEEVPPRKVSDVCHCLSSCCRVIRVAYSEKTCRNVVHVGNAMLKSASYEKHDRHKKTCELCAYRLCSKADPYCDAYEEVT